MLWRHISGLMPPTSAFLDDDPGTGGGGGDRKPDANAQVEALKARYGSAQAALAVLWQENYDLREERRQLREDVTKAKPAEGSVVLAADDAKAWEAYKALGKPEEVQSALQERDTLKQQVQENERKEGVAKAATAANLKADVLQKLPGAEKLRFEVRTEKVDGDDVQVAYVTETEKQGATPQKLTDYVEATWPEFLPALAAEEEAKPKDSSTGPTFPKQQSRGAPPKSGQKSEEDVRKATLATADYSL